MAAQPLYEKRLLFGATVCTIVAFVFQLVAICTNNWLVLSVSGDIGANVTGQFLVSARAGLWRVCREVISIEVVENGHLVETKSDECFSHNLFPTEEEMRVGNHRDSQYMGNLDYTRTAIAFTIIAIIVISLGHCFAFYTLRRPRYIIKRLTALLHLMAGGCILVLNEVFSKSTQHEKRPTDLQLAGESQTSYGYSFVFSWMVFVVFIIVGLIFLFTSHKRKAEMADVDDVLAQEDEPMQLGRV
ncbi:epithelial membrane protein 2-like [Gigantopelta aegis]|uniref:epithelial membrane protein 2-like n=1 Tax=Gigantopelta aegis TaxID=1735272 RepID=UPI001B887489|nr:epithelial membrane protein 2-like [Gigantopelta aegis]